jgi:chemotaxis protein CheC
MRELTKTQKGLKMIATLCVEKCSQLLSKMLKTGACIELENIYYGDVTDISKRIMNEQQAEIVATYIDLVGDAPFKFLFYTYVEDAFAITDLILRRPIGTTQEYDMYAASAVQELGNILASACTNVFSRDFHIELKPSPPIVVKDYISTIFQEYIMGIASEKDELLIMESTFKTYQQGIECRMFILPFASSEKVLQLMMEQHFYT